MPVSAKVFLNGIIARNKKATSTSHLFDPFMSPLQTSSEQVSRLRFDECLDLSGTCLRIYVGRDSYQKEFWVPGKLFTSRSELLKRAVKEEMIGGTPIRTVSLSEDKPEAFQMYAVLNYTGYIASRGLPNEWQSLVDVYILAERLQDSQAKNHIIDAMHSYVVSHVPETLTSDKRTSVFNQHFSVTALNSLYERTTRESQARKLVVDLFADNVTPDWFLFQSEDMPHAFLVELTIKLICKRSQVVFGNMISLPSSLYHEKPKTDESKQKESSPGKSPASTPQQEKIACPPRGSKQAPILEPVLAGSSAFTVSDAKPA